MKSSFNFIPDGDIERSDVLNAAILLKAKTYTGYFSPREYFCPRGSASRRVESQASLASV